MHSDSDSDRELERHINTREFNYNLRLNIMAQNFDIKYLSVIPEFDGNPVNLTSFISVCDDLLQTFWNAENVNHLNNKLLIHGITSKITGRAKTILYCNSNAKSWDDDIKPILKQHFGDNRDLPSLNNNLTNIRQRPKETGLQFLDRIQEILLHICNYIDLNVDAHLRDAQKTLFRDIALRVFVTYLNEPLGSRIRARNPPNLSEACSIMIQEENILYLQKPGHQLPQLTSSNNYSLPRQVTNFPAMNRPALPNLPNLPTLPAFPQQPIRVQPRQVTQHFPTNRQVFGRPQQQQQNVFKPNSPQAIANAQTNNPTPMSVNTRNTMRPQFRPSNVFRQTGPPNFTFQELHNNEISSNENSANEASTNQFHDFYADSYDEEFENPTFEPLISNPIEDDFSATDHFLELPASGTQNN